MGPFITSRDGQTSSSLASSAIENGASRTGTHSLSEAMLVLSFPAAWLVCSFHNSSSYKHKIGTKVIALTVKNQAFYTCSLSRIMKRVLNIHEGSEDTLRPTLVLVIHWSRHFVLSVELTVFLPFFPEYYFFFLHLLITKILM